MASQSVNSSPSSKDRDGGKDKDIAADEVFDQVQPFSSRIIIWIVSSRILSCLISYFHFLPLAPCLFNLLYDH